MSTQTEMPRYQSHKKVWALKIKKIDVNPDGSTNSIITPEEEGYAPFKVNYKYYSKHLPKEGGYYVRYEDGYESFSPAKAFEEGYTLIQNIKPYHPNQGTRADYINRVLEAHDVKRSEVIVLNGAEVQSGVSRVHFAEGLIKQLDSHHDVRNVWLLNYGIKDEAVAKRKKRGLEFVQDTQSCELGKNYD